MIISHFVNRRKELTLKQQFNTLGKRIYQNTWVCGHFSAKNSNLNLLNLSGKYKCSTLYHVQLFTTSWTVAHQAPVSMEFSRQEYWISCRQVDTLPSEPPGQPRKMLAVNFKGSPSQGRGRVKLNNWWLAVRKPYVNKLGTRALLLTPLSQKCLHANQSYRPLSTLFTPLLAP